MLPSSLDTRRYEKNPVVLFNHNLNMPVGYAEKLVFNDDRIMAKTRYASTPEARKVHQLVKDKVLRTHSIGFITLEAEVRGAVGFDTILTDLKSRYPERFDEERSKKVDRIVTKALMVEYSIVTVPSNEEAVINEVKAAKQEIEEKSHTSAESATLPPEEPAADEQPETKGFEIKVVKRASTIKKVMTAAQREQKRLQAVYESLWGI